ncbi:MAG: tRNA (adenosine(37)-N6)-threonylcarbamoyltransferase complex ATPase subunit type 1 TsaE [Clostridia bacterium]|nr:tRNA (adenosine(37)-N6)-threonylcarbamoyltransferase complex ATPase subunit type 1 TsaE [Clostridia bacterium]
MMRFITDSPERTAQAAAEFAKKLLPGDVIAFTGGMGAGKTTFTAGLLRGLGNSSRVYSPTFALVNDYGGDPRVLHFDMYRVTDEDSLYSTGFYDYLDEKNILIIEWSENVAPYLPENTIKIDIRTLGENEREITINR